MKHMPLRHPYVCGKGGRSVRTEPGGHVIARVTCSCTKFVEVRFRQLAGDEQMDRKIKQKGWRLDPPVCTHCQRQKKEARMASTAEPTTNALVAQAKLHRLLDEHFDAPGGQFAKDWNDERISKETGLHIDRVVQYRQVAFGELKVPSEVQQLHDDINALAQLKLESDAGFEQELAKLRSRCAELTRQFKA